MNLKQLLNFLNINGSEIKGTDKDSKHSYLDEYELIFSEIKEKKLEILEIGVQFGGSSLLWQEYFKNSNLTLIDIEYQITDYIKSKLSNRCNILIFDAYNIEKFENIKNKKYDIIIDDGPHTLESQLFVINNYLYLLNEGGILIIEDIQKFEYIEIFNSKITNDYSIHVKDLRNIKNRYDDILLIIKKI